jgi:multiple sugar transport system ATP-binding protein
VAEVQFDGVTKVYAGGVRAVDDLSLTIADGEFLVLVGPSGCGKTTALRLLAGLEQATAGCVRIGGAAVDDVAPKDRDVAMVFQNYALYPHMKVYRNIAFGLLLRADAGWFAQALRYLFNRAAFRTTVDAVREIRSKVEQAADLLGIRGLLDRRPQALSGGQRQRVALGRAIVRSPRVFLFDEPLSNLDARLRVEMRAELKRLHRRLQTTTVHVTHDQAEAMILGDRVAVMRDGRIQQCGRPMDVYHRPATRFVAAFVGTPTMNLLPGRLIRRASGVWFERGATCLRFPDEMASRLADGAHEEVTLGFRSEAVSAAAESSPGENVLEATVTVVEPLGDRTDVVMETAEGERIVWRSDAPGSVGEGQQLAVRVDLNRAHVFGSGEDGVNLTLDRARAAAQ